MPEEPDSTPHFDDAGRLIAPLYGDRYYSDAGGLAESTHVFLDGNQLAHRFERLGPADSFTIGETGFGTGLNFLASWRLFDLHAPRGAVLRFVSAEKHPLERETMRRALLPWGPLRPYAYRFLKRYAPAGAGTQTYTLDTGRAELTLRVGEAAAVLAACQRPCDAWFLDGFTPARNPGMWSPAVFTEVARLSRPGTTLATYTAAGFVRRGLAAVGFSIEKRPGFGAKRDMTVGRWPASDGGTQGRGASAVERSALVIGAGVAGSFVARALADRGWAVIVADRQPLERGEWPTLRPRVAVVQPKLTDHDDPGGQWLRDGFALFLEQLREPWAGDPRVGWVPCGVFHPADDPSRAVKLHRFVEQFAPAGFGRWITRDETPSELGVVLDVGGVVVETAGVVRPAGLCAALLDSPRITLMPGTSVESLKHDGKQWHAETSSGETLSRPVVVVANAADAKRLGPTRRLDLIPVRGQVTLVPSMQVEADGLTRLSRVICGGAYLTPAIGGMHSLGASFLPGETDTGWRDAEHAEVCGRLATVMPGLADRLKTLKEPTGWVGVRCTTPTRLPITGPIAYRGRRHTGLYVSLGHGSHGIVSACHAAQRIADAVITDAQTTEALG